MTTVSQDFVKNEKFFIAKSVYCANFHYHVENPICLKKQVMWMNFEIKFHSIMDLLRFLWFTTVSEVVSLDVIPASH